MQQGFQVFQLSLPCTKGSIVQSIYWTDVRSQQNKVGPRAPPLQTFPYVHVAGSPLKMLAMHAFAESFHWKDSLVSGTQGRNYHEASEAVASSLKSRSSVLSTDTIWPQSHALIFYYTR